MSSIVIRVSCAQRTLFLFMRDGVLFCKAGNNEWEWHKPRRWTCQPHLFPVDLCPALAAGHSVKLSASCFIFALFYGTYCLDLHLDMAFLLLDIFFISTCNELYLSYNCMNALILHSFFRRWKRWLVVCFHSVPIIYLAFKLDLEFLEECMNRWE